jgi:alkylated DNA nucleotide flippase Atl1
MRQIAAISGSDKAPDYSARVMALDRLPKVGTPATRALEAAGYTSLSDLAGVSREHLATLHGVGPKAIRIIQAALEEHALTLS